MSFGDERIFLHNQRFLAAHLRIAFETLGLFWHDELLDFTGI